MRKPSFPHPSTPPSACPPIYFVLEVASPTTCHVTMHAVGAGAGTLWQSLIFLDSLPLQHVQGAQFQPGECHADAHKDLPQVLGEGGRQVHAEPGGAEGAASRGAGDLLRGKRQRQNLGLYTDPVMEFANMQHTTRGMRSHT